MSEMKGTRKLKLPEELLARVSGGYNWDALTQEEKDRIMALSEAVEAAIKTGETKIIDQAYAKLYQYHMSLVDKYDK